VINDTLAVDAGSLGLFGTPREQARIRHILISHSHIDHIASLPVFLENAYEESSESVTVHGSAEVLRCLQQDLFNNRLWPDFPHLPNVAAPFLKLAPLEPGRTIELEGLRITPVALDHVVPTLGFLIADRDAAVAIISDTGPTDEVWRLANATPELKAIFLEVTFPNCLNDLAAASKHLTPALFLAEVSKLKRPASLIAVHIKPRFQEEVVAELQALGIPNFWIGQPGKTYRFAAGPTEMS
jgi:ribonuclease BN (tRNA processing enzyme)